MGKKSQPSYQPYQRPEDRPNGPWSDDDLDDVANHLARGKRILKHGKLMAKVKPHAKKMAEKKRQEANHIAQVGK